MKNKRGQFFLLAAIILVSLIIGIFLYSNKVFLQESKSGIESLKQEVAGETGVVIDYGLYRGESKLEDFIEQMSGNLLTRNSPDLIFFYGNNTQLKILNLGENNISYNLSGTNIICPGIKQNVTTTIGIAGFEAGLNVNLEALEASNLVCLVFLHSLQEIEFKVNEAIYTIPLNTGKNFYFVIKREQGENVYVATTSQ